MNLIRIPNMNSLYALQNHEENEIAWIEDIKEYRVWHDGQWVVLDPKTTGVGLSLYIYIISFFLIFVKSIMR